MASAKFLEEALGTDVDESTVNAIVGSLETQLVTSSGSVPQHGIGQLSSAQNLTNSNNNSAIVTNGGDSVTVASSATTAASAATAIIPSIVSSSSLLSSTAVPAATFAAISTNNNGGVPSTQNNKHQTIVNGELSHLNNHCVIPIQQQATAAIVPQNSSTSAIGTPNLQSSQGTLSAGSSTLVATTTTSSVLPSNGGDTQIGTEQPLIHSVVLTGQQQPQQHLQQHQQFGSVQNHTILMNNSSSNTANTIVNMSKNNEPVKLVYPSQAVTGTGAPQPAVINMNNRVTFTSQSLPNGTISLSTLTSQPQQAAQHPQTIMQTSTPIAVSQIGGTTTTTIKSTVPQQQQQPTLVIQKQATSQNVVGTSLMPGVQIVNMRPGTPTAPAQQKTVATVSPRVVTHMVGARPANSAITLSALSNLQTGGQPGQAILLKTENGQFQLLRVGPSPVVAATAGQQNITSNSNQTIRLQTVPAVSRFTGPPLALRKTIVSQQPVKSKANQQAIASSAGTSIVVNSVSHTAPIQTVVQTTTAAPPIASVAPVPALSQQSTGSAVVVTTNATPANQQNTKEKCRKFLANLLELSSREPKPVERNVRTLIQELIDANVEPEEFCDRLERLLNASPQPCLIGFLKKSLPLLRQSLVTKELAIEGIKPPPHNVAFAGTITTHIPAQVRPVSQTIGPTQVRMVTQATPRPIGQTTITRHTAPARLQAPIATTTAGHRMINATVAQIRPGTTTIVQQASNVHQSTPPALQPVSATIPHSGFTPGGAQIRPPVVAVARPPAPLPIRQPTTIVKQQTATAKGGTTLTTMKVGSTQIKQIIPNAQSGTVVNNSNNNSNINSISTVVSSTNANISGSGSGSTIAPVAKPMVVKAQNATQATAKATAKDKDKKSAAAAAAASSSFYQQSMSSSMYGDDDINDVAAMGGVNLAEESQRILGSTELIGTQIRSCKDEVFLHLPALQAKIRNMIAKHGLEEPNNEVAVLISHATQERLKNIVEKLAVIAEHRIDIIKVDPRYEITKDVRGQIKFLEELDKAEQKRHEEQEREMLMRAAKSRSKTEDPEQAKLKAKAKEMQRAEMEELRQRDANLTALQAIGPRKKPRLDGEAVTTSTIGGPGSSTIGAAPTPLRPRIKRVNLKDMIFYLEQERDTCRSSMLYKAYLK